MDYLFVGGPVHGKIIAVADGSRPYAIPATFEPHKSRAENDAVSWYHPKQYAMGQYTFPVFVLDGLENEWFAVNELLKDVRVTYPTDDQSCTIEYVNLH